MKTLIVYYSRTGNTRFVAKIIGNQLGADIEEIVDLKNRDGNVGWMSGLGDVFGNRQTKIAPTKKTPQNYDLVVVGTPDWAWSPAPAISTYLSGCDFSGKKVALFFTYASSLRQIVQKTKALMPNAVFVDELILQNVLENREESKKKTEEWCLKLKSA
jgi:flavodoxin